jgi:hypothetical protein
MNNRSLKRKKNDDAYTRVRDGDANMESDLPACSDGGSLGDVEFLSVVAAEGGAGDVSDLDEEKAILA